MDSDSPLDFELDDPLVFNAPPAGAKRSKIIGLDDLINEHYKEECKAAERNQKAKKKKKHCNSDDDEEKTRNKRERDLTKLVDNCQKQVHEMAAEVEISQWGLQMFGRKKKQPPSHGLDLQSCKLINNFSKVKLGTDLDMDIEKGEHFMEGLLKNGWLLKLVYTCAYVEDCLLAWTFEQMLYSSNDDLHSSACIFWCDLISNKVGVPGLKLDWLPSFSDIKKALEVYGYDSSPSPQLSDHDPAYSGPPLNIKSWVKFVTTACLSRGTISIFSVSEVEELFPIIISLFLDHHLQGIIMLLDECVRSATNFFTEDEWHNSCKNIADSTASSVPKDLNCLRVVECISQVNARGKNLRSQLSFQILIYSFEKHVTDVMEILEFLASINMKEKNCDFIKLYIYLVLVENWLCQDPREEKATILTMWCKYLRKCSTQITSTDWRPFASKVRNRAYYLLQATNRVQC